MTECEAYLETARNEQTRLRQALHVAEQMYWQAQYSNMDKEQEIQDLREGLEIIVAITAGATGAKAIQAHQVAVATLA